MVAKAINLIFFMLTFQATPEANTGEICAGHAKFERCHSFGGTKLPLKLVLPLQ